MTVKTTTDPKGPTAPAPSTVAAEARLDHDNHEHAATSKAAKASTTKDSGPADGESQRRVEVKVSKFAGFSARCEA